MVVSGWQRANSPSSLEHDDHVLAISGLTAETGRAQAWNITDIARTPVANAHTRYLNTYNYSNLW